MIVRFNKVKDTHDFVKKFKYANKESHVIMRDITIQDNCVKCIISMRDDDVGLINMHPDYRDVEFKVIDRNKI